MNNIEYPTVSAKIKVEYECRPIRHLAIQCPYCHNWFNQGDIAEKWICNDVDLEYTDCSCPICNCHFRIKPDTNLTEEEKKLGFPEFYEQKCKTKKVTWE